MDAAVGAGRVKKVWWHQDRARMALLPTGSEPPEGWFLEAQSPAWKPAMTTGLPQDPLALRRDVADAFAGVRQSASLDTSQPPAVRVVEADAEHAAVQPVPPQAVIDAWKNFADENKLDEATKSDVAAKLGSTPTTVWARVDVPGDTFTTRLGARFHRARRALLLESVRKWFAEHGKDPAAFDLAYSARARSMERTTGGPAAQGQGTDRSYALRERLKRIIDRMSLEQLHELRIPVEFLDV